MTDSVQQSDAVRLSAFRRQRGLVASKAFALVYDDDGPFLETETVDGERLPVARFSPGATIDEMRFVADSLVAFDFLDGLVRRAAKKVREIEQQDRMRVNRELQKDPKNFAAEASIKCGEGPFQRFLAERYQLEPPLTTDRTIVRLRSLLGVTSRKELNHDAAAAERWKTLRAEFDAWWRAGR